MAGAVIRYLNCVSDIYVFVGKTVSHAFIYNMHFLKNAHTRSLPSQALQTGSQSVASTQAALIAPGSRNANFQAPPETC